MKSSIHTKARRLVKALALGMAATAVSAPVAQAGHEDGIVVGARDVKAAVPDGYQPQLRDVAASAIVDGWQVRFAQSAAIVQVAVDPDGYQPQLRDAAAFEIVDGWQVRFPESVEIVDGWTGRFEAPNPVAVVGYRVPDGYQPDVGAREPFAVPVEITGRFDWADAGIGAGMAFGAMLLAAAAATVATRARRRVAHS